MMTAIEVREPSQIALARRRAAAAAGDAGLDSHALDRLAVVVTEAATNLLRHGGGGEILVGADPAQDGAGPAVDVLALDRGAGMDNVQACLADGFSTAGGAGTGLGAIMRMSDHADIWSRPGRGTVVHARFLPGRRPAEGIPAPRDLGGISVPMDGQAANGDTWAVRRSGGSWTIMVCDGLGHGVHAAAAADAARRGFAAATTEDPAEIIEALHGDLRGTRGAVIAVASIRPHERRLRYAGVGNAAAWLRGDGGGQRLVSFDGVVGRGVPRPRTLDYAWEGGALAVMHSDGIGSRWDLEAYPGLSTRAPILIAAVLHRDFRRQRDDSTVVVARIGP